MKDYQFIGYLMNQCTAITNICSTRIYHGVAPQTSSLSSLLPFITYYQLPGGARSNGLCHPIYSINCRASNAATARDLADEVSKLFGGTCGTGCIGIASTFVAERMSVVRDTGIIPETDCFNAPVDVLLVYSVDTVS